MTANAEGPERQPEPARPAWALRLPPRARDLLLFGAVAALLLLGAMLGGALAWETGVLLILLLGLFGTGLFFEEEVRGWRLRPRLSVGALAHAAQAPLAATTAAAALERLPDPFMLLDGSGRVVLANRAALRSLGSAGSRRHVAGVIRVPVVLEAIERVLAGGGAEDVEYSTLVPVERHFAAHVGPVPGDRPGDVWVVVILHDLTAVKRVDQMRADFVANASHELRTPLAALTGFIDTLRGHAREDPEARDRFLGIMQEQAARMRRLIDDLLSLSRIELNEHVPPQDEVDLVGVLSDVISMLGPLSRAGKVRLALEAPERLPPVQGERDELVQVFQNLIDNAIKYGTPGTEVTVTLGVSVLAGRRPTAQSVFAAVRDRGEGIAREHLPRLTERFYRVDAKRSRDRGGTGLGLAIVKHIVARHRGSLTIDSKLGEGSTFTVFLPAVPGIAAAEAAAIDRPVPARTA